MSPNEAAELLGVSPSATRDEVQRAYDGRLGEAAVDDRRRDALTAARDALLAASAWQAPSQPPYPPAGAAPGGPNAGPWYPPAPARRGLSTGAIVGITLGSAAAALVVLLVAVISIVSIAHSTSRLAEGGSSAIATPFDEPSDGPLDDDTSGAVDDYNVDGVQVHYVDGWTFELTSPQACVGAVVTVGFADTTDGGTMDVWSTVVDLPSGEPYELTVPDDASEYDYAGIDSVECTQT